MTVWWDRGLLDEGQVLQTQQLLSGISSQWDFNAFHLDRLTGGHNLSFLCIHLFHENGLMQYYHFDPLVVWKFFALVEKSYHATNPYHNAVHAADVTQAMSRFLSEPALRNYLEPVELLASIIAAVCHDLDHPGLNEKFLIATSSHLAGLYNNTSVLENHHWSMAVALMHESGLSSCLTSSQHQELVEIIRSLILATDISRQQEFLTQLRFLLDRDEMNLAQARCRHFMLQIALKCADISNPCRSWSISRLWSYRACEEFFRQGDKERELNLPVTPFCDRQNISVAKVQSTFYRYVASPLFEEWHRFLNSPLSTTMTQNLTSNQARWDLLVEQEGPSPMAESVISQTSTSSSSNGGSQQNDARDNFSSSQYHRRFSRSSADEDDSDPCTSYPYLPLDDSPESLLARRHSLPFTITFFDEDFVLGCRLHRQFSLGERRNRQAELLSARAAHRRRIFASRVAPPATLYDSGSIGCSFNSSVDDPLTENNGEPVKTGSSSSPSLGKSRQDSCSTACSCSTSVSGSCCTSGSCCCTCTSVSALTCRRPIRNFSTESDFCSRNREIPSKQAKEEWNRNQEHFVNGNANNKSFRSRSSFESRSRTSVESSFETFPRVSFHIGGISGGGVDIDEEDERPDEKENFGRRGSAPSHLLLSQINFAAAKLASTATAVADSLSAADKNRNLVSTTPNALDWSRRRGSLPSDLVHSSCAFQNFKLCSAAANFEPVKKRKHKNGGTTKIVVEDVTPEMPNGTGFIHPKRPLRRGSFRSSSFGGVGNRRGSAPVDVLKGEILQKKQNSGSNNSSNKKRIGTKVLNAGGEDILYDIRNFSHLHIMKTPPKVSSSSQLMQKQSSFYGANGRRGSLPVEYISMSYMR